MSFGGSKTTVDGVQTLKFWISHGTAIKLRQPELIAGLIGTTIVNFEHC